MYKNFAKPLYFTRDHRSNNAEVNNINRVFRDRLEVFIVGLGNSPNQAEAYLWLDVEKFQKNFRNFLTDQRRGAANRKNLKVVKQTGGI